MDEALKTEFERILSENINLVDGLVELVMEWKASGIGQKETLDRFEACRAFLRTEGREADEDNVMDVMDRIVGWCSDHQRLFGVYSADFP